MYIHMYLFAFVYVWSIQSQIGNIEGCYFSAQCDILAFSVCPAEPTLRCDCFWRCLADIGLRQCLGLMQGRVLEVAFTHPTTERDKQPSASNSSFTHPIIHHSAVFKRTRGLCFSPLIPGYAHTHAQWNVHINTHQVAHNAESAVIESSKLKRYSNSTVITVKIPDCGLLK